ncbi:hypothetical protein PBRA_006740 [Plasmodiophora brassicae]|uniref:Uncharacterized protein n=1 Tax=Plasmodiophora brassicae TaxID=37360 RepID=A0A0G4IU62_PLABS|nr:hypothetical protein PBRA_006740 [Plasmodiophora brassicae]
MLQAKVLLFVSQDARDRDQLQEPCSLYLNPPASSEGELADTTRYEDAHRRLQGRTLFLPDSWTNRLRHHVADATSCMAKSMPVGIGAASDNMASVTRVILCTGAVVSFFVDGVDTIRRCIIDESVAGVVGHAIVSCAIMVGNVLFLGMETPPKILAVSVPTSKPSSEPATNLMAASTAHAWIDSFDVRPRMMGFDRSRGLLCIGYARRIGIVSVVAGSGPDNPARRTSIRGKASLRSGGMSLTVHSELTLDHTVTLVTCTWSGNGRDLIVVSQEVQQDPVVVRVATYPAHDGPNGIERSPSRSLSLTVQRRIIFACGDEDRRRIILLGEHGMVAIVEIGDQILHRKTVNFSRETSSSPVFASFHPSNAVIVIFFEDGSLVITDVALQRLQFPDGSSTLQLSSWLGYRSVLRMDAVVRTGSTFVSQATSRARDLGTIGTGLRFGSVTDLAIVADRIRMQQLDEVNTVLSHASSLEERVAMVGVVVDGLMVIADTVTVQGLSVTERLDVLLKETWRICKSKGDAGLIEKVKRMCQRFINRLIAYDRIDVAFQHAVMVEDDDGILAIYAAARHRGYSTIASHALRRCKAKLKLPSKDAITDSALIDDTLVEQLLALVPLEMNTIQYTTATIKDAGDNYFSFDGLSLLRQGRLDDAAALFRKFDLQADLQCVDRIRRSARAGYAIRPSVVTIRQ